MTQEALRLKRARKAAKRRALLVVQTPAPPEAPGKAAVRAGCGVTGDILPDPFPPPGSVELTDAHRAAVAAELFEELAQSDMARTNLMALLQRYYLRALGGAA